MSAAVSARTALVVGGSVAGLFTAHLLRAAGWTVTVVERARDDLAGRGAGIGTRPELFAVLRRIGIELNETQGVVPVRSRKYIGTIGETTHELALPSINSAWDRIYRPLRDAMPAGSLRAGVALEQVLSNGSRVQVQLSDGSRVQADLLVGADGVYSTVRRELFPEAQSVYTGYVAWRGVLDEADMPSSVHEQLFHHMSFSVVDGAEARRPANELFLCMPMPGRDDDVREGHRRFHFIWFRTVDFERELPALCTDATGKRHGVSIPPPLIRPEVIADLREQARATLPPPLAALVERVPQPLLQPIYDLECPRLAVGRAALVGDAGFVARPHVATGVTKAALDAQCLADSLAAAGNDIEAGLAAYNRIRQPLGRSLVARARSLGAYLESGARARDPQVRQAAREHRPAEAILAEYGAAGSIHEAGLR